MAANDQTNATVANLLKVAKESNNEAARIKALHELKDVLYSHSNNKNKVIDNFIIENGGLNLFLDILKNGNNNGNNGNSKAQNRSEKEKIAAARLIWEIGWYNPRAYFPFLHFDVEEEVILMLLMWLKISNNPIKKWYESIQWMDRWFGGIGDNYKREVAAGALAIIGERSAENKRLIHEKGGLLLLMELLENGHVEAKKNAVAAISRMSYGDRKYSDIICDSGFIPILLQLIRSNRVSNHDNNNNNNNDKDHTNENENDLHLVNDRPVLELKRRSIVALSILSVDSAKCRDAIADNGGVVLFMQIWNNTVMNYSDADSSSHANLCPCELLEKVVDVLKNLVISERIQQIFVENNGFRFLLDILNKVTSTVTARHLINSTNNSKASAAYAIGRISHNFGKNHGIKQFVDSDGMDSLIKMLMDGDENMKAGASFALCNISINKIYREIFCKKEKLISLIRALEIVVSELLIINNTESTTDDDVANNSTPEKSKANTTTTTTTTTTRSSRLLCTRINLSATLINLSFDGNNRELIAVNGILPLAIDIIRSGNTDLETKAHIIGILDNICKSNDSLANVHKEKLLQLGAIPLLFQIVKSSTGNSCSSLPSNIGNDDDDDDDDNGDDKISNNNNSSDKDSKFNKSLVKVSMYTLKGLSMYEAAAQEIIANDGMRIFLDILKDSNAEREAKMSVIASFWFLFGVIKNISACVELGGVITFIEYMKYTIEKQENEDKHGSSSKHDYPNEMPNTLLLLLRLCGDNNNINRNNNNNTNNKAIIQTIHDNGGFLLLINILKIGSDYCKSLVASLFQIVMMIDPSVADEIVRFGAVELLIDVIKDVDDDDHDDDADDMKKKDKRDGKKNAIAALANVTFLNSDDANNSKDIIRERQGIMPILNFAKKCKSDFSKANALALLGNLTIGNIKNKEIITSNGIELFLELTKFDVDDNDDDGDDDDDVVVAASGGDSIERQKMIKDMRLRQYMAVHVLSLCPHHNHEDVAFANKIVENDGIILLLNILARIIEEQLKNTSGDGSSHILSIDISKIHRMKNDATSILRVILERAPSSLETIIANNGIPILASLDSVLVSNNAGRLTLSKITNYGMLQKMFTKSENNNSNNEILYGVSCYFDRISPMNNNVIVWKPSGNSFLNKEYVSFENFEILSSDSFEMKSLFEFVKNNDVAGLSLSLSQMIANGRESECLGKLNFEIIDKPFPIKIRSSSNLDKRRGKMIKTIETTTTLLYAAVRLNSYDCVKYLLWKYGNYCNVNWRPNDYLPMFSIACLNGNISILGLLLFFGCNPLQVFNEVSNEVRNEDRNENEEKKELSRNMLELQGIVVPGALSQSTNSLSVTSDKDLSNLCLTSETLNFSHHSWKSVTSLNLSHNNICN